MAISNGIGIVKALRIGLSNAAKSLKVKNIINQIFGTDRGKIVGCKKLSDEQEKRMIELYRQGESVQKLQLQFGYKTKKSILDKVRKYCDNPEEVIKEARENRKQYSINIEKIDSAFNAYFIGLMLTDGYIISENSYGIQLTDEDAIKFISDVTGQKYHKYEQGDGHKPTYRIVFYGSDQVDYLKRYSITERKSHTVHGFDLTKDEERYLPFLIRGIIDGDGCIHKTSKGSAAFYVVSASKNFILWLKDIFEQKMFMSDMHISQSKAGLWKVETSLQINMFKLMALVYPYPYGMLRKYNALREMFRDYNRSNLDDFIWND